MDTSTYTPYVEITYPDGHKIIGYKSTNERFIRLQTTVANVTHYALTCWRYNQLDRYFSGDGYSYRILADTGSGSGTQTNTPSPTNT